MPFYGEHLERLLHHVLQLITGSVNFGESEPAWKMNLAVKDFRQSWKHNIARAESPMKENGRITYEEFEQSLGIESAAVSKILHERLHGKYMDLEVDFKGEPIGAYITNYLLEKSRVTWYPAGERNFHIFYQILAGADVHMLKTLKLQRNPENYDLLQRDKHHHLESRDDREDFHHTKRAMETLGFSSSEILNVFRLVSVVLKLGNISFVPINNIDGTEGSEICSDYEMHDLCELLGGEYVDIVRALTQRTLWSGEVPSSTCLASPGHKRSGDSKQSSLNRSSSLSRPELAEGCESYRSDYGTMPSSSPRDNIVVADLTAADSINDKNALAKAIYNRLFTWLVSRINELLKPKGHGKRRVLGLLDIYGFEVFTENSFEQLIINFCNEKLHQLFLELAFKEEQEEYIQEGLEWEPIEEEYKKVEFCCWKELKKGNGRYRAH
ncbi:unnamed protein product [Darwinula stevensoni]|uniref:Myosin motor domain-containing protein n=1 Tax=Darwinula stevensoni TaxID=69355 RepID=A0A7R8XC99_9CRUS|nr:unnamed protein product [Darwinula stevensoni]CAG0893564.1 unnamed protein product [Darwinula stevensoni]